MSGKNLGFGFWGGAGDISTFLRSAWQNQAGALLCRLQDRVVHMGLTAGRGGFCHGLGACRSSTLHRNTDMCQASCGKLPTPSILPKLRRMQGSGIKTSRLTKLTSVFELWPAAAQG